MIALTFCDIHVLYGTEFDKLVVKYPELAKALLLDSGTIVTSDEISSKKPARKGWGTVKREVERIEVGTTVIDKAISEARKRLRENQENSQTRVEAMVADQGSRLGKLEDTQNAILKQQEQIMTMLAQMSKGPSQMLTPKTPLTPSSPGKGAADGKLKEKL
ncbi:hypothetical protein CYMTET_19810 [Cymbomonas tetramitiformis]|uniref:Uncharacterized protein n=1 Tax=Cymbomonas tetramitiformis TaxID=36881 RepID=A0AAE0G6K4_9CHLO|nr:hypothetical protein CYMTET_19810 [Cymbomonas tetramitiformis]